jgi:MSHA biogenesis protein MshL
MSFTPGDVQEDSLADTNGSFQLALSNNMLDFLVDALSRQGNVKVLASPKISTLNNEKAVIRVVREEAFFNLQTQVSQGLGGNVTAPTINVQIVPIGIVMDIVPQIAENGEVILSINPDISELLEVKKFEVQGASATQPVIERRSIDTVARVKDGETLVIAGIIKEKKTETLRGIPFLYRLPLIGSLFRRTEQRLEKTELVILITPKVIAGKSSAQLTSEEIGRIEEAIKPMHLGDVFGLREGMQGEMEAVKKEKKK